MDGILGKRHCEKQKAPRPSGGLFYVDAVTKTVDWFADSWYSINVLPF